MVKPLRHRQTKEAATDMFDLKPLRHTSTLPNCEELTPGTHFPFAPNNRHGAAETKRPSPS